MLDAIAHNLLFFNLAIFWAANQLSQASISFKLLFLTNLEHCNND